MKLRIRGNSIRIRVSKSELAGLAETGSTEDAVRFSPTAELRYRLEVAPSGGVEARFAGAVVTIAVPRPRLETWLAPEAVSISAEQAIGGGQTLRILVEKDYTCLAPRAGEDDSDLFANPQDTASRSAG